MHWMCFRQILPVIQNGTASDTINACISSSSTWSLFRRLHLTINLRLQFQEQAETLLAIGEGRSCNGAIIMSHDTVSHKMLIGLPHIDYIESSQTNSSLDFF